MTMRLMSYNIRYGGTGREELIASVIRASNADMVILQEASDPGVVARLSALTGMMTYASRGGASTGFLSARPVVHYAWHHPRAARHPFLEIELADPPIRVFGLHLSAWFSKWSERRRRSELRALLDGIRHHQHGFHVIAGDFNAMAPGERLHVERMPRWIRAMIWLSGNDIARETIQLMLDERYVDAWRLLHPGGTGHTFPTWDPHVRLDYFFAPRRDAARLKSCTVLSEPNAARAASDHFPLLAELDA